MIFSYLSFLRFSLKGKIPFKSPGAFAIQGKHLSLMPRFFWDEEAIRKPVLIWRLLILQGEDNTEVDTLGLSERALQVRICRINGQAILCVY